MKYQLNISKSYIYGMIVSMIIGSVAHAQSFSSADMADDRRDDQAGRLDESLRHRGNANSPYINRYIRESAERDYAERFGTKKEGAEAAIKGKAANLGSQFHEFLLKTFVNSPEKLRLYLVHGVTKYGPSYITAINNQTHVERLASLEKQLAGQIPWETFMERMNKAAIFLHTFDMAEKSKKQTIDEGFKEAAAKLEISSVRISPEFQKIADSAKSLATEKMPRGTMPFVLLSLAAGSVYAHDSLESGLETKAVPTAALGKKAWSNGITVKSGTN